MPISTAQTRLHNQHLLNEYTSKVKFDFEKKIQFIDVAQFYYLLSISRDIGLKCVYFMVQTENLSSFSQPWSHLSHTKIGY